MVRVLYRLKANRPKAPAARSASDSSGNPLDQPSGFALVNLLTPSGPFGALDMSSTSLSSASSDSAHPAALAMASSVGGDNPVTVPELSTLLLALVAILGAISTQF